MEKIEYKDMFGLYFRVKEIRRSYKLLYNRKTNKIELFDENLGQVQMQFDLPILPNILNKIMFTKVENAKRIFRKIEEENCKIEQKTIENAIYSVKNAIIK